MLALVAVVLAALPAAAQDVQFIRALEEAQRARPAQLSSTARIAPESEPGSPLVVHGRAFAEDGRTPLANAIVFAYHTDTAGLYDRPGTAANSWRLKGWAKTGADGRFEFRTIRPGAYPSRNIAAHIHVTLFAPDGARYHGTELHFDNDPLVPAAEREETKRDAMFGPVRTVRRDGAVEHVDYNVRVEPSRKF